MNRFSQRALLPALLIVLALAACKKKPAEVADAGGSAAVAETPDANAAEPVTTNAANVARFGDEVKIDKVVAVVLSSNAQVREDPAGGKLLATIPKGASVTQLAEHSGHLLVVFDNPKTPTEKLIGWVGKEIFSASAAVHAGPKVDGGAVGGDGGAPKVVAVDAGSKTQLKTGIAK